MSINKNSAGAKNNYDGSIREWTEQTMSKFTLEEKKALLTRIDSLERRIKILESMYRDDGK